MNFNIFMSKLLNSHGYYIILGFYGYQYLPEGHKSFEKSPVAHLDPKDISVIPTILLCIMQFCSSYGVTSIPPMLLSEIFPFKYLTL